VLEVGAGEGALAWRLARQFEYVGLEPDPASHAVAAERLARLGRGRVIAETTRDLLAAPNPDRYDLVCGFEVLEHVPDDVEELARWRSLLRLEGFVLLSVPAHQHRFGAADRAFGHMRRYSRADLEQALEEAGFAPVWIDAWGAGLGHLLEWVRNRLARTRATPSAAEGTAGSGRWLQPRGPVFGRLSALGAAPFRLVQHAVRRGNLGIGWVALARRVG
jgi:SAM-dependent methyltransferase